MFNWQCEGGQLIKSNYKPEYPVGGGGGGNSYMVSVTPVGIIFYGHALSSKNGTYGSCEWCKMSNKLSFLSLCQMSI